MDKLPARLIRAMSAKAGTLYYHSVAVPRTDYQDIQKQSSLKGSATRRGSGSTLQRISTIWIVAEDASLGEGAPRVEPLKPLPIKSRSIPCSLRDPVWGFLRFSISMTTLGPATTTMAMSEPIAVQICQCS